MIPKVAKSKIELIGPEERHEAADERGVPVCGALELLLVDTRQDGRDVEGGALVAGGRPVACPPSPPVRERDLEPAHPGSRANAALASPIAVCSAKAPREE
jgi:hypothetical protein